MIARRVVLAALSIFGALAASAQICINPLGPWQTANIRAYGIISTGVMSGSADADGLGNGWAAYRIVPTIPSSAVMAGDKDSKEGPLSFGINGVDYRNYKGHFDWVIKVPVA